MEHHISDMKMEKIQKGNDDEEKSVLILLCQDCEGLLSSDDETERCSRTMDRE